MNPSKQAICPERIRTVPKQFSWIDQRLVRERHLEQMDVYAAALYLFLVTVADAQGLSWYGDASIAQRLSTDEPRVRHARGVLVRSGLLAFANGLYQVLALDRPSLKHSVVPAASVPAPAPSAPAPAPITPVPASVPTPAPVASPPDRTVARHYLAEIHAALERRS